MDESDEPFSYILLLFQADFTLGIIASFAVLILLLIGSGLVSGSEIAFFSMNPTQRKSVEDSNTKNSQLILKLMDKPKELLATILISNNFINVAIILLSSYLSEALFNYSDIEIFGFIITAKRIAFSVDVVAITFLILLFGEVIPKIYASRYPLLLANIMAYPLVISYKVFDQIKLVALLVRSTNFIDKKIKKRSSNISVDQLSHALEITNVDDLGEEDQKILQGIVKFGNTEVKQIMTPRMDVIAFEMDSDYQDLLKDILDSGFSRIPVYEETFDNIKGILYLKDLLPYLDKEPEDFEWQSLIREPFFVPEKKKIDNLLNEFRDKKIHLAIVVDEYGGSQGIVTLEDVIEEIVGDISDEFDDEDLVYSKLDDNNFVFEGKTPLNDVYRVLDIDGSELEQSKGEADTLAGLVLELSGKIPKKNEKIKLNSFTFTVDAADRKRIKRIKVTLNDSDENQQDSESRKTGQPIAGLTLLFAISSLLLSSCDQNYIPKPKSYHRIELKEPNYVDFSTDCPYEFEYNKSMSNIDYTRINKATHPCWFNLYYPELNARIHFSYFNENIKDSLSNYTESSRKLAMKHLVKAKDIQENLIYDTTNSVFGITYDFAGSTASAFQFFVTDSTKNYLHASLYFEVIPNPDSLVPVEAYVKKDLYHIIETFNWKD